MAHRKDSLVRVNSMFEAIATQHMNDCMLFVWSSQLSMDHAEYDISTWRHRLRDTKMSNVKRSTVCD